MTSFCASHQTGSLSTNVPSRSTKTAAGAFERSLMMLAA